jgi:hypothetical protein
VQRVAALVEQIRPAVLHTVPDLVNALTAEAVGTAAGIAVVHDTRSFAEEDWLTRTAQRYGWDLDRLAAGHGLPDRYRRWRDLADRLRRSAGRVVVPTAAAADRVAGAGVPRERITVAAQAPERADVPARLPGTRCGPRNRGAAGAGRGRDRWGGTGP